MNGKAIQGNIDYILATSGGDIPLEVLGERIASLLEHGLTDAVVATAAALLTVDMLVVKQGMEPTFFRYENEKVYPRSRAMKLLRECADALFTDEDRAICERARANEDICDPADAEYLESDDCMLLASGSVMRRRRISDGSISYTLTWMGRKLTGDIDDVDKI